MKRETNTPVASQLQNPDITNVNDKDVPYILPET